MSKWVSFYGNAMSIADHKIEQYSKNVTLRYPIYCPFDGSKIRLTFDNYCSDEPVTITQATIGIAGSNDTLDVSTMQTITWNSITSVTIDACGKVCTDAISLDIHSGDTLVISYYLESYTHMRSAVLVTGPLSRGYFAVGNHCTTSILPLDESRNISMFYFLSDAEILTHEDNHSIVCYGDSITAGAWPDEFALLCKQNHNESTAIVRKAASGTRILREYHCITYESYGLKATNRFPHELPVSGAKYIIIQQGINDIIHPVGTDVNPFRPMSDLPTAEEIIDGLRYYIKEVKKQNCLVYLGTLLPIEGWRTYAPFREELRQKVNHWIMTTDEIDGAIDFASALADLNNSSAFRKEYDSGDHLHPSALGYKRMAEEAYACLFS